MRGYFITLEGGDGSGKTTQLEKIIEWLDSEGIDFLQTREPGGTSIGQEIREIVLHSKSDITTKAEALLYAADRAQHIEAVVRPALQAGQVVLQDRYIDSSVAYQGAGRVLSTDDIRKLSMWATGGLVPDLTILLDVDASSSKARLDESRTRYDRLESEAAEFHERVRQQYLAMAADEPQRFVIIDATQSIDDVFNQIKPILRKKLAECYA